MTDSPWMDEELTILAAQTARFAAAELTPHVDRWRADRQVDRASWRRAGAAGILCVGIPVEYGGGGGSIAHEAVVSQELVRAGVGASFGGGNNVSSGIVARYVLEYGTEAQKQRWLPLLARGEAVAAIAMTEPGTGSDLRAIRTRARAAAGGYSLSGTKMFISNGQIADLVLVAAKTGPDDDQRLSLLMVETEAAAGFQRGPALRKLGMHGQDTSELFFDNVFVPAENLLGATEGQGFAQLTSQLAWERMLIAIEAVATLERVVDLTVDYCRTRPAFGRMVLDFQNSQFNLAECRTTAVVARSFLDAQMVRLLAGDLDPVAAAMAKYWCTEQLSRVADTCLQLHGGYGYMDDNPVGRIWADTRVLRIVGGTNEIMKLIIARAL